ncbi:hypothetical protein OC25_07185 [Pedobacter kyungheensis]|uniref:Spore protein YkvP/CgeB glycosyl transferase-like domain-containing protein n=1 Tax=Pedobacter kyungheensis TaxID=1069985 RepID=A0A0C1DM86_9SPHI|nr:glycosyltransferase [Pedobacter kyungheensis]KIA95115.1 hypothetical protein OC25_07185 [Pedobacter kyungheensis]
MDGAQNKTICLITPGHISSNPRLVKEATSLAKESYNVHLIFTQYVSSLVKYDQEILEANPSWTFDALNWTPQNLLTAFSKIKSGLRLKTLNLLPINNLHYTLNRNYGWQLAKAIKVKAALYIGHNLGALPVAVNAAKANQAKSGFDAEDFHRQELTDDQHNSDYQLKVEIENYYIPKLDYFTAASPLIGNLYKSLYNIKVQSINNVFPKIAYASAINPQKAIKLFWFSQTLGPNRGIETIINAINSIIIPLELHLLGKFDLNYQEQLNQQATAERRKDLFFHHTVSPDQLLKMVGSYDVGIASENTSPLNRNICLTNKLFTYIQCGLAVVASNTTAQSAFMSNFSDIGKIYHDASDLASIINYYHENRTMLNATKKASYELGQKSLNWENECQKFLILVKETIG